MMNGVKCFFGVEKENEVLMFLMEGRVVGLIECEDVIIPAALRYKSALVDVEGLLKTRRDGVCKGFGNDAVVGVGN